MKTLSEEFEGSIRKSIDEQTKPLLLSAAKGVHFKTHDYVLENVGPNSPVKSLTIAKKDSAYFLLASPKCEHTASPEDYYPVCLLKQFFVDPLVDFPVSSGIYEFAHFSGKMIGPLTHSQLKTAATMITKMAYARDLESGMSERSQTLFPKHNL